MRIDHILTRVFFRFDLSIEEIETHYLRTKEPAHLTTQPVVQ